MYPQRIALPDAHVAVELKNAAGILIAEERFETEGRQVPLPFVIEGQADTAMVLRAGIFVAGRPAWLSEPLPIAAGDGAVTLPPIRLQQFQSLGFATTFRCGDRQVEVGFVDDMARMKVSGRTIDLMPQPAASGARFVDPEDEGTWFWSRGSTGTLSLSGETATCHPMIPEPIFPLRARGQEPGWLLEVSDGAMRYSGSYGAVEATGKIASATAIPDGARYTVEGADLAFDVTRLLCRDLATGMPHPLSVAVTHDGEQVQGCGGEPASLLTGVEWSLAEIEGGLPEGTVPNLLFLPEGRVAGSGGCNRITGGYSLTGEGLSFGPMASTMMACAEAVMAAERRFMDTLATVDRFDLDDEGALLLIGADTMRLRLTR
jgi:heat shock protein HslJ/membrane-bound inhibitor of C-type lysozyme